MSKTRLSGWATLSATHSEASSSTFLLDSWSRCISSWPSCPSWDFEPSTLPTSTKEFPAFCPYLAWSLSSFLEFGLPSSPSQVRQKERSWVHDSSTNTGPCSVTTNLANSPFSTQPPSFFENSCTLPVLSSSETSLSSRTSSLSASSLPLSATLWLCDPTDGDMWTWWWSTTKPRFFWSPLSSSASMWAARSWALLGTSSWLSFS